MPEIEKLIDKLVVRILAGTTKGTPEELQLYTNHSEEIERRLQELYNETEM